MGELMGYVDQITSYGFSSTDLGNKASLYAKISILRRHFIRLIHIKCLSAAHHHKHHPSHLIGQADRHLQTC
jgi:hypothetical protein